MTDTLTNVVVIKGGLPAWYSNKMCPVSKDDSIVSIDSVLNKDSPINPKNIDWNKVTMNSWFICIDPITGKNYSFPICESENREKNYERAKYGIAVFQDLGYDVYSIGS